MYFDQKDHVDFGMMKSAVIMHQMHQTVKESVRGGSHIPACFILASEDTRICNETAKEAARERRNEHDEMNIVVGAMHDNMLFDS